MRALSKLIARPRALLRLASTFRMSLPDQPGTDLPTKKTTLFDLMTPPSLTNLMIGAPGEFLLKKCTDVFKQAAIHRMEEPDAHLLFQYGPEPGDRRFLETLATFLSEEYQDTVEPDHLMASGGATHGLFLLSHLLFDRNDIVFMENPTYFIGMEVLRGDAGMKLVTVPMDEHGIIPEELEKALEAHKSHKPRELTDRKPFWGMLYVMPTFHNPTGLCLPPDRCRKLVQLARKYNLLVICDDVYNLLGFPRADGSVPSPKRLFAYDDKNDSDYKGNVISNSTFSKIFGPGIRLGWMELPLRVKDLIITSGVAQSGGGFNHTISGIMSSIISLGLLKGLLKEARQLYQSKCEAAIDVIRTKMPGAVIVPPQNNQTCVVELYLKNKPFTGLQNRFIIQHLPALPLYMYLKNQLGGSNKPQREGGYFLWIKLPKGIKASDVLKQCDNVTFTEGNSASPTGDFRDYIRISFSFYDKDILVSSIEKIANVVNSIQ